MLIFTVLLVPLEITAWLASASIFIYMSDFYESLTTSPSNKNRTNELTMQ